MSEALLKEVMDLGKQIVLLQTSVGMVDQRLKALEADQQQRQSDKTQAERAAQHELRMELDKLKAAQTEAAKAE